MGVSETIVGAGVYSIPQAARIAGVGVAKARRWLRDDVAAIERRPDANLQNVNFLELMELKFISIFREEGVSMDTIRKASRAASQKFGTAYPFAVKRFDTDGLNIFATLKSKESDKQLVEELNRGQYVFEQIARPFFRKLDYRTSHEDEAILYWPLEKKGRVVLDPERHFGQPIDARTGVPTRTLYDASIAGGGEDAKTVAMWFDVPLEAVQAAVMFEQSL